MVTLTAVALTCWFCALLALPRKPRLNDEVQELVYARLLGRQQVLMLVALVATAGAFFAFVALTQPNRGDFDFNGVRYPDAVCIAGTYDPGPCAAPDADTVIREIQDDGKPAIVATVPADMQRAARHMR
jgi:hypothetical protein